MRIFCISKRYECVVILLRGVVSFKKVVFLNMNVIMIVVSDE